MPQLRQSADFEMEIEDKEYKESGHKHVGSNYQTLRGSEGIGADAKETEQ